MKAIDHRELMNTLLPSVLEAGRLEMRFYNSDIEVERKEDKSPVTEADRQAETILVRALRQAMPDVPVVAEEMVSGGELPHVGDCFFLVDPLDGTREFINKRGEFTINIGLISAGAPVFGIVYAPALNRLFATLGEGEAAECQITPDAKAASIDGLQFQPITARQIDHSGLTAFASRSHASKGTERFLSHYTVKDIRQAGSSLKFCLIARGDADVYPRLGPTSEWDTAAGHAILLAAGGSVVKLDETPLGYGKREKKFLNPNFVAWGKGGLALPPVAALEQS